MEVDPSDIAVADKDLPPQKSACESDRFGTSRILMHAPDITLKGRNQSDFQKILYNNVKSRLRHAGFNWHVKATRGRVCVDVANRHNDDVNHALEIMREVPGIASLALTRWLRTSEVRLDNGELNWTPIDGAIVELARRHYRENATFAININRADKQLPVTSEKMARRLGDIIRGESDWETVNLKRPDQIFYIDIYPDGLYLYTEKIKSVGGLPVGSGGRVLSLLSGGIDSPVASYQLAKRGCSVDLLHMAASHVRDVDMEKSVVVRLAAQLSRYTLRSRLFIAPYTYIDLALSGRHTGYELVLFRRFLMQVAERLAGEIHAQALVTGDSLGQVASQTMENLVTASGPVKIPIFRPLIGFNKQEIIDLARLINTYNTSIEPYKDCCALISRQPKTRSTEQVIAELEQALIPDYEQVIRNTLEDMVCIEFKCGQITGC